MKRAATVVTAICLMAALTVFAGAATFTDDLSMQISSDIRTPDASLRIVQRRGLVASDEIQLTLPVENNITHGGIRYRLTGLEYIAVRIYSPMGTFAVECAVTQTLNFGGSNLSYQPSQVLDTHFNLTDRQIYLNHGGSWHVFRNHYSQGRHFAPAPQPAGNALVRMGISAYVSASANGPRRPIELNRTAINWMHLDGLELIVAEDFQNTQRIPPDTQYLWIEINDPGGNLLSDSGTRTSLAWVRLNGRDLRMGRRPPQYEHFPPITENPQIPEYNPPTDTNRPAATSQQAAPRAAAGTTSPNTPREATHRVEGVITAPPAPSPPQARTPGAQPEPEPRTPEAPAAQETAARQDPVIYEISREPERSGSLAGVIFYIAVVALLVGYFLVRPKKRED